MLISPGPDIRFYIRLRMLALNESDGTAMGPIERQLFDRQTRMGSQLRVEAFRLLQQLWQILSEATPDLVLIQETGEALEDTLERINTTFQQLLELNPKSSSTMRAYA